MTLTCALGIGPIAGCGMTATEEPPVRPSTTATSPEPQDRGAAPVARSGAVDVSWDTDRDRNFAEFLREKSGGMLRAASIGIAAKDRFQVVLDKSVAPEDTLDLTKSLMKGARSEFPDHPITLSVFDPGKTLILRAHYKVGQGISYQVAHDSAAGSNGQNDLSSSPQPAQPSTRSGATEADRKFAEWAEDHGKSYLRYVEADLERHGRLWFGVTRDVKPADVPDLTKSLLEGAHKEFPRSELVASVFDPEGEKIGKATLARDGSIHWER